MRYILISLFLVVFLSIPVLATNIYINKDSPNTEVIVTNKGFGYKTRVQVGEGNIILNIPPNVEVVSLSSEPIKTEDISSSFLIFTLYKGKKIYFEENINELEIMFVYEGSNQFYTNLYDSMNSLYN
ncbi:hypothetical protein HYX15_03035 [Candidatus Woesearchaeota archaeon]|nr:hypothetical protein [Candidatus Woesearchaeota archaeon]